MVTYLPTGGYLYLLAGWVWVRVRVRVKVRVRFKVRLRVWQFFENMVLQIKRGLAIIYFSCCGRVRS